MKPPPFEYDDPETTDEALSLLNQYGDETKVLAGGQSLVPLLNFRLARPDRLIDINRVAELDYIREEDGTLRIGAMTRQATLERSDLAAAHCPLLIDGLHWVGHAQIRNRGTVGGSVAHADPAAELPVVCAALDATLHVRSSSGERAVAAEDFFVTHLTTAVEPTEILTEIELPVLTGRIGTAFVEFARRHGDFALGGAAVVLRLDDAGACSEVRIALLSAAPTPIRATDAEQVLAGCVIDEEATREAQAKTEAAISPTGDIHGSGEYRQGLIGTMVRRALSAAYDKASG